MDRTFASTPSPQDWWDGTIVGVGGEGGEDILEADNVGPTPQASWPGTVVDHEVEDEECEKQGTVEAANCHAE